MYCDGVWYRESWSPETPINLEIPLNVPSSSGKHLYKPHILVYELFLAILMILPSSSATNKDALSQRTSMSNYSPKSH